MHGRKLNISDEVAIQNEKYIPALPPYVSWPHSGPAQTSGRPGILKFWPPPSLLPQLIDLREPTLMASPYQRCRENKLPFQQRSEWKACILCHVKKERCSLTPITCAQIQAEKNRAILEAADTRKHNTGDAPLYNQLDNIHHEIKSLNAGQETISGRLNTIISGIKHLWEDINSRMAAGKHTTKKLKRWS